MKSREEWFREIASSPEQAADAALQLQTQLAQAQKQLQQIQEQLAQPQALIAELKQQIFGSKSENLTTEQEKEERRERDREKRRHVPPVELQKEQVVLEPPDKICPPHGPTPAGDRPGSHH